LIVTGVQTCALPISCGAGPFNVQWYVGFTNVGRATMVHGTVFDLDAGCLTHFEWTNCLAPGQGLFFPVCSNANFTCTNCSAGGRSEERRVGKECRSW